MYNISIPDNLFQRLQRQAKESQRPIDEIVRQALDRFLPSLVEVEDDLPPHLQVELKAMEQLSDTALWALASSTLTGQEQNQLALLAQTQQLRELTELEQVQQDQLLSKYDEMLLRRAHAAILLQARGYDLSDPATLQST